MLKKKIIKNPRNDLFSDRFKTFTYKYDMRTLPKKISISFGNRGKLDGAIYREDKFDDPEFIYKLDNECIGSISLEYMNLEQKDGKFISQESAGCFLLYKDGSGLNTVKDFNKRNNLLKKLYP